MKKSTSSTKKKAVTTKVKTVVKETKVKDLFVPYVFDDGKITIKIGDMKYLIWFRNILCIMIDEVLNNTFTIFFDNDVPLKMSGTLKEFMKRLKYPDFIQTHNSSIANMFHARRFVKLRSTGTLFLNCDHVLKVSKIHFKEVDHAFDYGSNMIDDDFIIIED